MYVGFPRLSLADSSFHETKIPSANLLAVTLRGAVVGATKRKTA